MPDTSPSGDSRLDFHSLENADASGDSATELISREEMETVRESDASNHEFDLDDTIRIEPHELPPISHDLGDETLADVAIPVGQVPSSSVVETRPHHGGSWVTILLIGYASAATLACAYLFYQWRHPNPHALESLPDKPPLEQHEAFLWTPIDSQMPLGHTLQLGQQQRFGNILVEPLRVERGPLTFSHFSGNAQRRGPSKPVLKLWFRFTNVSNDQTIAPLDASLVFDRRLDDGRMLANNFVCRRGDKPNNGPVVFMFDEPPASEWDLVGQRLGTPLAPGESLETYLATTEEGIEDMSGELLWRVHLRKGYSPKGNGVTTLIEIAFSDGDVADNAG